MNGSPFFVTSSCFTKLHDKITSFFFRGWAPLSNMVIEMACPRKVGPSRGLVCWICL